MARAVCPWILACALAACAHGSSSAPGRPPAGGARVIAAVELPFTDARSAELSSVSWDAERRTLLALSDSSPTVVPFVPDPTLTTWTAGEPLRLDISVRWDGEGMVVRTDEIVIANEIGPQLHVFSRAGEHTGELPLPTRFGQRCRRNKCLEALGATRSGRYLFTANEWALEDDGPGPSVAQGTVVRLVRLERGSGRAEEYAYRADALPPPGGGDSGVVDLAVLDDDDLLVLERSYDPDAGTSVRLYRVRLAGASDVSGIERLPSDVAVLPKQLVVDLGQVPEARPRRGDRLGPLANYEGIALGPSLGRGEQVVFLVSDNNANAEQSARLLVLALRGL